MFGSVHGSTVVIIDPDTLLSLIQAGVFLPLNCVSRSPGSNLEPALSYNFYAEHPCRSRGCCLRGVVKEIGFVQTLLFELILIVLAIVL